ncbi:hypothetical protein EVB79_038 [Rhizobium phage RHph_N3_13]|nr:hypothetical protein EVB79_038 [Rhizobium phage RHph_N3_13]
MSEFTEKYESWDEVIFPAIAAWRGGRLIVEFEGKEGTKLWGTVVENGGGVNYPKGYSCDHWNTSIGVWKFKRQQYKYDPDQTGDTEEDI